MCVCVQTQVHTHTYTLKLFTTISYHVVQFIVACVPEEKTVSCLLAQPVRHDHNVRCNGVVLVVVVVLDMICLLSGNVPCAIVRCTIALIITDLFVIT